MITRCFDDLLGGGYQIVYADPAWRYKDRGIRGGTKKHYKTGSLNDWKDLRVSEIIADDAVMFLWATWPLIEDAFELIPHWGFKYKTLGFDWVKTYKSGKLFVGCGHYTRSNPEPCLLAVRGKGLKRVDASVLSVIMEPKIRGHSEKPIEARRRVERLYGEKKRVELFARSTDENWDSWGDEI